MNVLSLFDGMSCGQIALNKIGIAPNNYYAAEIDKHAITVTQTNYPGTIPLGDVTRWREWSIDWASIDLVTGGFPCQAWSTAGRQLGDKDERGALFWTMLDIMSNVLKHNRDAKFLIENVKMKREFEQYITYHSEQALGCVEKTLINSALLSAQNRERYYWTNFHVDQPLDAQVTMRDIVEQGYHSPNRAKSYCLDANYGKGTNFRRYFFCGSRQLVLEDGYMPSPMTKDTANDVMRSDGSRWRKLTVKECERLQTVPEGYVSNSSIPATEKYRALGNGWTVDVIAHILKAAKL